MSLSVAAPNVSVCERRFRPDEGQTRSFETLYGGQFTLSTQLIILNNPVILSHRRSTTISLETYLLNWYVNGFQNLFWQKSTMVSTEFYLLISNRICVFMMNRISIRSWSFFFPIKVWYHLHSVFVSIRNSRPRAPKPWSAVQWYASYCVFAWWSRG